MFIRRIAQPPIHHIFSSFPRGFFAKLSPLFQHLFKGAQIQFLILRPSFKLAFLTLLTTQRATHTSEPFKAFVIQRAIGDAFFLDIRPNIFVCPVYDGVAERRMRSIALLNHAAGFIVVHIKDHSVFPGQCVLDAYFIRCAHQFLCGTRNNRNDIMIVPPANALRPSGPCDCNSSLTMSFFLILTAIPR